jgi:hypothetical protein
MKRIAVAILSLCLLLTISSVRSEVIDLTRSKIGAPPPNFAFTRSSKMSLGRWVIAGDPTTRSKSAIQQSTRDDEEASLAIYQPVLVTDVKVRTSFKLIDGRIPSAGIAVRVTSPNDYHLISVNAFEGRVAFVRVKGGVAEELADVNAEIALDRWQALEVIASGDSFKISLDDQWILTAFDSQSKTEGRTALWTGNNCTARFDQVEITPVISVQN